MYATRHSEASIKILEDSIRAVLVANYCTDSPPLFRRYAYGKQIYEGVHQR